MPDENDSKVEPENQKSTDLWDSIKEERRRKNLADNLREERRKKSPPQEKNPPKDEKNDQP